MTPLSGIFSLVLFFLVGLTEPVQKPNRVALNRAGTAGQRRSFPFLVGGRLLRRADLGQVEEAHQAGECLPRFGRFEFDPYLDWYSSVKSSISRSVGMEVSYGTIHLNLAGPWAKRNPADLPQAVMAMKLT